MTRNDWTPIVVLAVLVLVGACVFGMVSTGAEAFDPTRAKQVAYATATAASIAAMGNQAAVQATVEARVVAQQRTAVAVQLTDEPVRRTQVAVYQQATLDASQFQATQTAFQREVTAGAKQAQFQTFTQFAQVVAVLVVFVVGLYLALQLNRVIRAEAARREMENEALRQAEAVRMEQARAAIAVQSTRPIHTYRNGKVKEAPDVKVEDWLKETPGNK